MYVVWIELLRLHTVPLVLFILVPYAFRMLRFRSVFFFYWAKYWLLILMLLVKWFSNWDFHLIASVDRLVFQNVLISISLNKNVAHLNIIELIVILEIIQLFNFWILVLIDWLVPELCSIHQTFFFYVSLSWGWLINYFWRLWVLEWVFIVKCNLVWRIIILFLSVIILIYIETIVVCMLRVVCAWYKIFSLVWMNNAFPIEAALVDFLVLIVNILRACKHLLVALLLAESDYILASIL